jgi:NAD(P)-dependent dehydrogenase (short-subunit alcohol dehydrogenase family)
MLGIKAKPALVTGAAGGIGQAIAWALAEVGADIAAHDRDITANLSSLVTKIERLGRR